MSVPLAVGTLSDTGTGVFSQAGLPELDGRLRLADFWTYLCGTTGDIRGAHFQFLVWEK